MFIHLVLFRPRPDVSDADRQAMFDALHAAAREIPAVRRFVVGKRVKLDTQYERMMVEDYPYSAVVELNDLAGLQEYLQHPRHEELGRLFYQLMESALAYDYETKAL